ncbi:hypothetical protein VpaJT1_27 [Vibrio phage VpaJT_1]|nr:hypothetical protein VpaJT1_27 [Vibrio phage VpaJT_1]
MRNTLLIAALVTIAPTASAVTDSEARQIENYIELVDASLAQQETDIVRAACVTNPSSTCEDEFRKILLEYKRQAIKGDELKRKGRELLDSRMGVTLEDNNPTSVPVGSHIPTIRQ